MARFKTVGRVLLILFMLNLFFVSIELLSAFKTTGSSFGENLLTSLAINPVLGLLIGIVITSIVQSSSATTALVVALAGSGLFGTDMLEALKMAIPVLMGANIGTSVTNMLVSLGNIGNKNEFERAFSAATVHDFFNILTVIVLLPIQHFTNFLGYSAKLITSLFVGMGGIKFVSPLKAIIKPQAHLVKNLCCYAFFDEFLIFTIILFLFFIVFRKVIIRSIEKKNSTGFFFLIAVGVGLIIALNNTYPSIFKMPGLAQIVIALTLLFLSLYTFVRIMRTAVLTRVETLLHKYIFKTPLRALTFGLILTAIIQSSSVTTSIIVPLAGAGILSLTQIFPYTLGANVGTTITAILASLATASPIPVAMALSHMLFNLFGIALFYPLRAIPINMAKFMGRISMERRYIPFIFIIVVFYLVPILLISIFR